MAILSKLTSPFVPRKLISVFKANKLRNRSSSVACASPAAPPLPATRPRPRPVSEVPLLVPAGSRATYDPLEGGRSGCGEASAPAHSRVPPRPDASTTHVAPAHADPITNTNIIPSASVALQTDDSSSDAIVITTIQHPPFGTHAELLRMDSAALVRAAQVLNARLPAALRIDVAEGRTDAYVRNAIEVLVGLRACARPRSGAETDGLKQEIAHAHERGKAGKNAKVKKASKRSEYRRTVSVDLGGIKLKQQHQHHQQQQQQQQHIFSSALPSASISNGNSAVLVLPNGPAPRTPTRPRYQRSRSHDTLIAADRPGFGVGFYVPGAPVGARLEILQEASEDEDAGDADRDVDAMDVDEDGADALALVRGQQQRPQKKRRVRSPVALARASAPVSAPAPAPGYSSAASTTATNTNPNPISASGPGVGINSITGTALPVPSSDSAEFSFDPFRVESPTPAARTRGLHRRMASFDEGRLHELQVLEGHAATRLFRSTSDCQPRLNMLERPAPTRTASAGAIGELGLGCGIGEDAHTAISSMNGRRKRHHYQPKERLGRTSTPKKQRTDENANANANRGLSRRMHGHDTSDIDGDVEMESPSQPLLELGLKPSISSGMPSSERVTLAALGASRKRKAGDLDSEGDFTFGIDGLSISMALSRNSGLMDLCR